MATLTLKNNTGVIVTITHVGVILPAAGQDTYTVPDIIQKLTSSVTLRNLVAAGTVTVNDGSADLTAAAGCIYLSTLWAQAGTDCAPQISGSNLVSTPQEPWGIIAANGQTTVMAPVRGMTQRAVDNASDAGYGADGVHLRQDTAVAANNEAFMANAVATGPTRPDLDPQLLFKFGLDLTTSERVFVGLLDAAVADGVILASDDPAAQYIGLQYSTARGDVNWQFVTDDGVTQGLVNSGVAVSTATFFLQIVYDRASTNVTLKIMNAGFGVLATHTFAANLPAATTELVVFSGVRNLAASLRSIRQYYINLVNRV